MARDMTIQQNQKQEMESMSKDGKEPKKRRFMNFPKKISPEDQPWILSNKSNEKAQRQ